MSDTLFRQEAIDAQRQRLAGTVVAAVPPSARLYTGVIVVVAVAIVLMLVFGSYATNAPVRGVVAYDTGVARVYPRSAAEVRRVLVREGEQVAAGQPLVELGLAQGERGLAEQIAQLDRQIGEIDRQLGLAEGLASSEAGALEAQRRGLIESVASLERQRGIASEQVGLAEKSVTRSQRLAKEGAGTQRQVDAARAELLMRKSEVENLTERLITARSSIADLGIKLSQGGLTSGKAASQLRNERSTLMTQRVDLVRSDHIVLTAPVAGRIADLIADPGRHATPDASLVTVVPDGGKLETWFYAPSQAVGFARKGQTVRLRFDAFPYQKYGSGRGVVTDVSRVAVDPAAVDPALGIKEASFRVRVRIESIGSAPATAAGVRPGMTVSGDLVLERRPLWALLFAPIRESLIR
ncbi:HlyD family efflux transporter periplasmic adaptor subunit [uncultured Sphingomonas sp.]|uniref:HlyD family secretion protein n=1 Tax=uncultured Sphingomonas sp. TaxID=158754 RepID=UPI0025DCABFB|nr:HlyD family efflux transporter periplasmic adaptor subunit [uncultured Sphingomonas sp.]